MAKPGRQKKTTQEAQETVSAVATAEVDQSPIEDQHASPAASKGPETARQTAGVIDKSSADSKIKNRISFALKDDGTVDWDSTRASNADAIKAVVKKDPTLRGLFTKTIAAEQFSNDDAGTLLGAIAGLEMAIARPLLKLDPRIAAAVFPFNEEEHKQLDPLVAAVMNKNSDRLPTWILKYREEIVLAKALGEISIKKFGQAKILQQGLLEETRNTKVRGARANGSADLSGESVSEMPQ